MPYNQLLSEAEAQGVYVYERKMAKRVKGLHGDNVICINSLLPTLSEKTCILAEELGHHHTSHGNITDLSDTRNKKQELRARRWAYEKMVPLTYIVQAHQQAIRNRYELARKLNITEDFLQSALDYYIEKYGLSAQVGRHTIIFEPLGVLEMFEF